MSTCKIVDSICAAIKRVKKKTRSKRKIQRKKESRMNTWNGCLSMLYKITRCQREKKVSYDKKDCSQCEFIRHRFNIACHPHVKCVNLTFRLFNKSKQLCEKAMKCVKNGRAKDMDIVVRADNFNWFTPNNNAIRLEFSFITALPD